MTQPVHRSIKAMSQFTLSGVNVARKEKESYWSEIKEMEGRRREAYGWKISNSLLFDERASMAKQAFT